MSVACLTHRLLLVLTVSNLPSFRGVALLPSPFTQSLASIMLFLDMGLPSVGGTYNLAHYIPTKVSKSWVHNQQLIKRWLIHGVVVAMAIGIADYVFCHWKSKG
jgi:hypothetical protein